LEKGVVLLLEDAEGDARNRFFRRVRDWASLAARRFEAAENVSMLTVLLVLILIAVCFAAKEPVGVRRQVASIRQFLEWTAVGMLENRDLPPVQREYLEKAKEDLIREGGLNERLVNAFRRRPG
jgi:hypothetical protein